MAWSPKAWCAGLTVLTTVLVLSAAPPALADSATISVTDTYGKADPAAGLPRVFTVSGTVAEDEYIYIRSRVLGGPPCAPTSATDSGSWFESYDDDDGFDDGQGQKKAKTGPFSFQQADTWKAPGTFVFCIWIAKTHSTITTPLTQTITFRSPSGVISASVNPAIPRPNQQATVTVVGSSEAAENVYAKIRRAGGAACAPSYDSDSGDSLIDGQSANGNFSVQAMTTQAQAGKYLICLWLADSGDSTTPIAGPQPETFTVAPPPAPCVVPRFKHGTTLKAMKKKLNAAHCTLGRVVYVRSRRYKRGTVIKLTPGPGATRAHGAPVRVLVSSGRAR
jgi:hypothetical protein